MTEPDSRNAQHPQNVTVSLAMTVDPDCWQNWNVNLTELSQNILDHVLNSLHLEDEILRGLEDTSIEVSFLYTSNARIQDLNRDFRGKDKPTNVLSFPDTPLSSEALDAAHTFGENLCLGDIALAEEIIRAEAQDQGKTDLDHLKHLIAHGFLHLLGFDHLEEEDAAVMEQLEIEILAELGVKNPYL